MSNVNYSLKLSNQIKVMQISLNIIGGKKCVYLNETKMEMKTKYEKQTKTNYFMTVFQTLSKMHRIQCLRIHFSGKWKFNEISKKNNSEAKLMFLSFASMVHIYICFCCEWCFICFNSLIWLPLSVCAGLVICFGNISMWDIKISIHTFLMNEAHQDRRNRPCSILVNLLLLHTHIQNSRSSSTKHVMVECKRVMKRTRWYIQYSFHK